MRRRHEPPPEALPIKLDAVSNGEFVPVPLPPVLRAVQHRARARITDNARRLSMPRREFLRTTSASAAVLLSLNELTGCGGGRYALNPHSEIDEAAADDNLKGEEFIFDVQTHHVSTERPWYEHNTVMQFLADTPQGKCGAAHWSDCYSRDLFIKEIFFDSDTHLGVLSALAGADESNPLHAEEAALTRDAMAALEGSPRLRIHGIVLPNDGSIEQNEERMQRLTEQFRVAAWKLYPIWGPQGTGYYLTDPLGRRTIERALALKLPLLAVHKGVPLPGLDAKYTSPIDVGPVAKDYPDATFLIYHSGYIPGHREGPYQPNAAYGVDTLILSLERAGVGKDGNVYAELGSTWREVMKSPDEAAHVIGKLLKHLGEDRILWGTDAIWYGSPQDQIQAFRAFEITQEYQERFGYPALTRERKAKILGLNAARVYGLSTEEVSRAIGADAIGRARPAYAGDPDPSYRTYGPRSEQEVLRLMRARGGLPT